MYQATQEFISALNMDRRTFRARLSAGDDMLQEEIRSITLTSGSCGADTFTIGAVFAAYADINLSPTSVLLAGREFFMEMGLLLSDGTVSYIPMGYYTISPSDVTKTKGQITVKGSDRIASKCGNLYVPSITFPASIQSVAEDIGGQCGVVVEIDASLNAAGVIETAMENLLCREALGYIAGLLGGFCYTDWEGKIRIAPFPAAASREIGADLCKNEIQTAEEDYSVGAITVIISEGGEDADGNQVDGVSFTAGAGTGITVANPYMNAALFEAIQGAVLNYAYRPGTAVFLGDPRLGPEDAIQVTNGDGESFVIPCMSIIHTYDGGLTTTVTAPGQASSDEGVQGPLTKQVERLASEMVLAKEVIAKKITADEADLKYATVENLAVLNQTVESINGDYASFKSMTAEEFAALTARIDSLNVENLDANYANIDFSNIGEAAIEKFLAKSGMIEDLVVSDQAVTGKLVGVTISGDLIEGNTIVADKLVIKGEDGLYYKLNTDGVSIAAEQTEYNSLNGTVILAKSVTAEKINVSDLVAFDATIGGFNITADSIYSGVKESIDNTTRGIYLDNDGQIAFGDANNYIKYYKDSDGSYKLAVSAEHLSIEIADAAKTATDYIYYDTTGLYVGNKSSGEWVGTRAQITGSAYNILDEDGTQLASFGSTVTIGDTSGFNTYIDSDSLDIRSGSKVLASFGADTISLGQHSYQAKVNVCNGLGYLRAYEVEDGGDPDENTDFEIYAKNNLELRSGGGCVYIGPNDYEGTVYLTAKHVSVAGTHLTAGGFQVLHADNYSSYCLPLTGGTLTGSLTINAGLSVNGSPIVGVKPTQTSIHSTAPSGGTLGWVVIATITIKASYVDTPIMFEIAQRANGGTSRLYVKFANVDGTDPSVDSFTYTGTAITAHLVKTTTSTWSLKVYKTCTWDRVNVVDFSKPYSLMTSVSVEWTEGFTQTTVQGEIAATRADDYLPLTGGTLTGNTVVSKSSGDTGFYATRSDTGTQVWMGVGSGGTNHGLYSSTLGKWMVYGDGSNVYLNGIATTVKRYTSSSGTTTGTAITSSSASGAKVYYGASGNNSTGNYCRFYGEFGTVGANNNAYYYNGASDVRLKTNITDYTKSVLPLVRNVKVREFDWIQSGLHCPIGFVADEIETVLEGTVAGGGYDEDGTPDYKSINQFIMLPYIVKGMQELCAVTDTLDARVNTTEARIEALQMQLSQAYDRIAEQDKVIAQLKAAA